MAPELHNLAKTYGGTPSSWLERFQNDPDGYALDLAVLRSNQAYDTRSQLHDIVQDEQRRAFETAWQNAQR